MSSDYQVTGSNSQAPFTLKIHRGDGMALLAMDWRAGKPPQDFVGFAIEYREPGQNKFWPLKNRIGFPGERTKASDPPIVSTRAPFQKFRWVHFPANAGLEGDFTYRVTPMFMDKNKVLAQGEAQQASLALRRDTLPGKLNVAYTRGFVSSQAFIDHYGKSAVPRLLPADADAGLKFKPTYPNAENAYEWMGFEARQAILGVLKEAGEAKAEVRVIAYDFNLPELLSSLVKLGPRLRIIIDDSISEKKDKKTGATKKSGHGLPRSAETAAEKALIKSAGKANVKRQHMGQLQHHKSIAVSATGLHKVVYGSTNFTWRGFYVQNNNAVIVNSKQAVDDYFAAFDDYFAASGPTGFTGAESSRKWFSLGLDSVDAQVAFSPHGQQSAALDSIADDIDKAKSSVFFSLAFLYQTGKPVGPAIGRAMKKKDIFALGVSDKAAGAKALGLTVLSPDDRRRSIGADALLGDVPPPFNEEPTGGAGIRLHHKFVVIDFDTPDARVYLGSYNFSSTADTKNGENLLLIRDRTVATSYMVEALRIYDHYRFRSLRKPSKSGASGKPAREKVMELKLPPEITSEDPWWKAYWDDPVRKRDREIFS